MLKFSFVVFLFGLATNTIQSKDSAMPRVILSADIHRNHNYVVFDIIIICLSNCYANARLFYLSAPRPYLLARGMSGEGG